MCRTNNTEALSTAVLRWIGDALNVRLTKSKTDQTLRDGYYIYANPFMPEIFPILALDLHLLLFMVDTSGAIFSGRGQAACLGDVFGRFLSHADSIGELTGKGSSTFATSGSLDGPSVAAVSCRAGWSLGSSLNRYLQKEAAGDQYVGRVVAGCPSMTPLSLPCRHTSGRTPTRHRRSLRLCVALSPTPSQPGPPITAFLMPASQRLLVDVVVAHLYVLVVLASARHH